MSGIEKAVCIGNASVGFYLNIKDSSDAALINTITQGAFSCWQEKTFFKLYRLWQAIAKSIEFGYNNIVINI